MERKFIKNQIFKNKKFEENIFYEDLNLTPSLVNEVFNIGFIDDGLYYYFQRTNSIMKQTNFNEKLLDIFKVLNNNYKLLYEKYPEEVEYLYITHLLRTATLRFLDYDKSIIKKHLMKINNEIKTKFPKWRRNGYYKKSSFKLKLICILAYNRCYRILKLIKRITKI